MHTVVASLNSGVKCVIMCSVQYGGESVVCNVTVVSSVWLYAMCTVVSIWCTM